MPYLAASLAQEGLCPDCRVSCPASSPAANRDSMSCSRTPQQERHLRHRRLSPSFLAEGHLTNHYAAALPKRNPKKNRTAKSWDFKVNLVYFPMTDDWLYTFGCGAMFPKQVERERLILQLSIFLQTQVRISQTRQFKAPLKRGLASRQTRAKT